MRKIKFRAWDILNKRMVDVLDSFWDTPYNELFASHPDSKCIELMQYTGLKDKNGKEIYEGDIVSDVIYKDGTKHIGQIVYDYNGYRIVTKDKSLTLDLPELLEVIGNIYESPRTNGESKCLTSQCA